MATSESLNFTCNSKALKKTSSIMSPSVSTEPCNISNRQISCLKLSVTPHACRLVEQTFSNKIAPSQKSNLTYNLTPLKPTNSIIIPSVSIQPWSISNCTHLVFETSYDVSTKKLVRKVSLFQIFVETCIFTLQRKVSL